MTHPRKEDDVRIKEAKLCVHEALDALSRVLDVRSLPRERTRFINPEWLTTQLGAESSKRKPCLIETVQFVGVARA